MNIHTFKTLLISAAFSVSLLPGFASAAQISATMTDSAFTPQTLSITQGDTVTWTNKGTQQHTVTFDTLPLSSMTILPGQSFTYTFSNLGSFPYHCIFHGAVNGVGMAGTVIVNPQTVVANTSATSQNTTQLQSQAQALLAQIQALQAQLAGQNGAVVNSTNGTVYNSATGAAVPVAGSAGVNSSACPNIGRVLKKGSTGDDVTRLQQFLARDPSVYPEATVTGYFGALTETAVQRWQTKYNIVSSGSPAATGFGVVGPRTAAAIALLCSTGASGGATTGNNSGTGVGGYIQVSPVSGGAPLLVNVVAYVNTINSCTGTVYTLNWGDNTSAIQIPVAANNCSPVSQTYQHTYTNGGTYTITLAAGGHQTTAVVTVNGTGSVVIPSTTNLQQESINASVTSGTAPLAVNFTGVVNSNDAGWCSSGCSSTISFGDNTTGQVPLPIQQNSAQNYSIAHTYQAAGTYTATLYQGSSAAGRPIVGSVTITVNGAAQPAVSLQAPTVTPNVGGNPLAVTVGFDLPACPSYTMNWGDGTPALSTAASCTSGGSPSSQTLSHTFSSGGTYTVTLTRGTRVDSIGLSISQ